MKKLLSICLAVLVVVGLMPVYALASEGGDESYVVSYNPMTDGGTVSVSGVTTNEEGKTVATGTSITVTATADNGYKLKELTAKIGDGLPQDITSGGAFQINGNVSIHAAFEKIEAEPKPEPETKQPEIPAAPLTSTVPVTTTPVTPLVDSTPTPTPTVADPVVRVDNPTHGTLTVGYGSGSTITGGGNASVTSGTDITISATPEEHYKVKSITVTPDGDDSAPVQSGGTYTVTSNVTVSAEFEIITHAVNYTVGSNGGLLINSQNKTGNGNVTACF